MRNVFTNTLIDIAGEDEKLVLLMAEVGYGVVEPFQKQFPDRFFNTGISEQSLVLTAAGMAIQGYHPVAYSMSSFLPTRAFEMIKDSVCYQNLPVTLVGIGSGISYGKMGSTHHAAEESALMRVLPHMEVIFPADGDGCRAALKYALQSNGPVYIGLEKMGTGITNPDKSFSKRWERICGTDEKAAAALIACGMTAGIAMEAADLLRERGIQINVYKAETVKPLDTAAIEEACRTGNVLVLDEHAKLCGIGAEIAEYILENGKQSQIKNYQSISIPDEYPDVILTEASLRNIYGLCRDNIVCRISACLEDKGNES